MALEIEKDGLEISYIDKMGFESFGMHRHSFSELLIVLEGDLNFLAENYVYHSSKSCLIFFKENRLHTTDVNPDVNYERYNINFKYNALSDMLDYEYVKELYENDCTVIPLDTTTKNEILQLAEKIQKTNDDSLDKRSIYYARHLLCLMLLRVNQLIINQYGMNNCRVDSYINTVIKYINTNLSQKIVISDIAEHFFVSRAKLIADFRNSTGVTIGEYIQSKRLYKAKKLLLSGIMVNETASLCGYPNVCHFIRTFKQHTKMTPLQYAKQSSSRVQI